MKKLRKKIIEDEIFREDETNLKKILDKQKISVIEVNLNGDDDDSVPNFDDVGESRNIDRILEEVKLSEDKKIGSFQEVIITDAEKVDKKINVDAFDGVDITKYIKDNV